MVSISLLSLLAALAVLPSGSAPADPLARAFQQPPASARPWVYWFWLNGNINREAITADLEAMARVGIGGVLIMETDQGEPLGPVPFASPEWRSLFRHVLLESERLGIQVNMNNDAGWCGSGGPWITPEQSMKKVTWSEGTYVGNGNRQLVDMLPAPAERGFYRDIALIAFPEAGTSIPDLAGRTGVVRREFADSPRLKVAREAVVATDKIQILSQGQYKPVEWQVPPGKWTVLRLGYTSTGRVNLPAPVSGTGLECDKLSREGAEAAFAGLMAKLIQDAGPLAPKTLVRTHIDSWEIGSQNWTERFAEEFKRRRGYDLTRYLPTLAGRVVGSADETERFHWDFRQTISDLLLDNYAGHMRTLAQKHGLGLSIEAYGDVCVDDMAYAGRADEPMSEFWTWAGMGDPASRNEPYLFQMTSAAHVYGKQIVGAEAFTSNDQERWLLHPATFKGLGDWQFSRGVNRFVFHRYALQPWPQAKPGMSMGPWGLHYERTQTWWDLAKPYHQYLARCQYLLQQGTAVSDVLYLAPEGAPNSFIPPPEAIQGEYRADACSAEALLTRASVRGGKIVFPHGAVYQALVLPPSRVMTPQLLQKVKTMVDAGAIVVGKLPERSPSLEGFPGSDGEVKRLSADLGRKVKDVPVETVLKARKIEPDFQSDRRLSAMHRKWKGTDVYFVSNPRTRWVNAVCRFRTEGRMPELWDAETGEIRPAARWRSVGRFTEVPLSLGSMQSVFVVFRRPASVDPVVRFSRSGVDLSQPTKPTAPKIVVKRAQWGPPGDAARTKDVADQIRRMFAKNMWDFQVAVLANEGDPALNVLKTLRLDMEIDGKPFQFVGHDQEVVSLPIELDKPAVASLERDSGGTLRLRTEHSGEYVATTRSGVRLRASVPKLPASMPIGGSWTLTFPPGRGAPEGLTGPIGSWSDSPIFGVRHFSGTAIYRKPIYVQAALLAPGLRQVLDLGRVEAFAKLRVNGREAGILWRPPYQADLTGLLQPGTNHLEIEVTNLWPNRMIGDEHLPEDSQRRPNGTLERWPEWLLKGEKSPTGRHTFTSWKLWRKDEAPVPSGLIGPVSLRPVAVKPLL